MSNSNKVITLEYSLFKNNEKGDLIESSKGKEPLVFLTGVGQMLPDFENNVKNKSVGESFSFGIVADHAYGPRHDDAIMDLNKETFMYEGKLIPDLKEGNTIGLQDQDGNPFPALVLKIEEETVKVDLNHPLAGQDLHFTGNILDVREATKDEIAHGHVHGPGGHHHH